MQLAEGKAELDAIPKAQPAKMPAKKVTASAKSAKASQPQSV